jgi:hypothetical protein
MEIAIIPKWLIKYIFSDSNCQYEANILMSNILIISIFIIFRNALIDFANALPHFCLFEKITSIQCPACGITRAFCELSNGNIIQAYKLNFASLFVALFFVSQIPLRIYSLCNPEMQRSIAKISKSFGWLVLVAILANWLIYLAIRLL